ncbi:hypothetical protein, partial [Paenibacillus koleovorans]|uniref:hypothetical protein n=1 Tax=Paenibacillus koleovorans TaxID=121608 RepID=UPI001C3F70C8
MYKLLVVDDEYHIRDGIVQVIPWTQYGTRVVGKANAQDGSCGTRRERRLWGDQWHRLFLLESNPVRTRPMAGFSFLQRRVKALSTKIRLTAQACAENAALSTEIHLTARVGAGDAA